MKKALGILSLSVLLFSTFAPSFTYATGDVIANPTESETPILTDISEESIEPEEIVEPENSIETEVSVISDIPATTDIPKDMEGQGTLTDIENFEEQNNQIKSEGPILLEMNPYEENIETNSTCIDGFEWDGTTIKKYCGTSQEITIPNNATYVDVETFNGKTITKITADEGISIDAHAFSGAILNGTINLDNLKISGLNWQGFTIGSNGDVTAHKIGKIVINEGGVLNTNGLFGILNDTIVNGTINFNGNGTINQSLTNIKLGEKGIININNGIEYISSSFNGSNTIISGNINYTESLESIDSSFQFANITTGIIINKINIGGSTFQNAKILGDISVYSNETIGGFQNTTITGNIIFGNGTIIFYSGVFNESKIYGDILFNGTNISFGGGGTFYGAQIFGNIIIDTPTKNTSFGNGTFFPWYISGDVIINSNSLLCEGIFQGSMGTIVGDIRVKTKESIILKSGCFRNSSSIPVKNIKLEGDIIDISEGSFNNRNIERNLELSGNIITGDYSSDATNDMKIGGNLIITGNQINLKNGAFKNLNTTGDIRLESNNFTGLYIFSNITSNGNLMITGNNVKITGGSFENGNIAGNIEISGGSFYTDGSFMRLNINENVLFNGDTFECEGNSFLNLNTNGKLEIKGTNINMGKNSGSCFNESIIQKSLNISAQGTLTGTNGSLQNSTINGNINFSGKNITMTEGFLTKTSKNGIISGDVNIKSNTFRNLQTGQGILNSLTIKGTVNIESKDIDVNQILGSSTINKNVIITGENITLNIGSFMGSNIGGHTNISGNNISLTNGAFGTINTTGDFIINSNSLYLNGGQIGSSHIGGNLKLPKNLTINGALYNTSINGKLILGGSLTKINELNILKGLIIEDGGNALENIFSGYQIGNNQVTINGTLSNIGAHAYSFKEGTRIINTITLADDFSTGNIGDGAFCIQNEGNIKVNAISSKKFTQEEKQDLYDRTCINLTYSGTYNLLLKVDGREGIVVYDGLHEVEIPNGLKKSGYDIKWYSNPELTGEEVNLNNQSFEEFEYTKTIYGKYVEIPVTPASGGGSTITPSKQESKTTEQEHNSADTEETTKQENKKSTTTQTTNTPTIKENVKKVEDKSLTRGEVAIMTNILLDVYPQLVEGKQELDDVTNACSNYADEQNFTKDEKKAITRLCKLSIMGIHNDTNEPLEEFLVNNKSTNDEFSKVINRSIETYNEKDLTTIKDALKKLEGDEENVVFGTVYEVFMSIKNIFN